MKLLLASIVALFLFAPACSRAAAQSTHEVRVRPAAAVVQSFRLQVDGEVGAKATFWVAYGPLAGHFGLIRLHPVGANLYSATVRLPGSGRTQFAYLRGNGVVRTPQGQAPGDPVTTIRLIGPVSVPRVALPTVQWQAPVG